MDTDTHRSEKRIQNYLCSSVSICGFKSFLLLVLSLISVQAQERELIQDNQFQRGFILYKPKPGHHVRSGELQGLEKKAEPVWNLLEWSSKFPLKTNPTTQLPNGTLIYSNTAKVVTIAPDFLALAANSGVEYGPVSRHREDPWVHLLVEQQVFAQPARLPELSAAKLHIEARLTRSNRLPAEGYNPELHAAQFQIFFTVQNRNHASRGFGDLVWFGVPIYDSRHRLPPAFNEQDWGGTAKFIFTPAGKDYTTNSVVDGQWVVIDKDLLPFMREALETAWSRGFLTGSKNVADYFIGGMNMGWELTGNFDVEMQVRRLSLSLLPKPGN